MNTDDFSIGSCKYKEGRASNLNSDKLKFSIFNGGAECGLVWSKEFANL